MQPKTKAITAAVTGSALGVAGLAWLAMPATAGEAPQLPAISAEELVQSVATTTTPALNGTVAVENNLGLPVSSLPGGTSLDVDGARVLTDGAGNSKLSVEQGAGEQTVVRNGDTIWSYRSQDNTARKVTVPAEAVQQPRGGLEVSDPATATARLLDKVRESSTVTVEGTARVAGRAAYELVLTPKPTERTLLREVRVAVDAEKRVPLRLAVMNYGTADPAFQVAFSDIAFAPQAASEFTFTPPHGAKVTEEALPADRPGKEAAQDALATTGDGWDTVITGTFPAEELQPQDDRSGGNVDPKAVLARFGKPVSGAFGSGYVITTKVVTALVTDDGRFAVGAVPEQVLTEALGSK